MSEMILGRENITKLFFRYTIPTVVGMAVLGLNTIVDGFFVGHYIGPKALACVNIALPFSSLLLAISIVVGIGMLTVMGRLMGEGQKAAAQDAFKTALFLIVAMAGVIACFAVMYTPQLARFLGASDELMSDVVSYIRIIGVFLPLLGVVMLFDYALKIIGKPAYAMLVLVVAVASHMALNYWFIVHLSWGIKGAAWATGLAYVIATAVALVPLCFGRFELKLWRGGFDKNLAKDILSNGSSEGLGEAGIGITAFLFNITLMQYVGPNGVAAFTAISYLSLVGTNMMLGIADGISSIISYNYGQGSMDRVWTTVKLAGVTVLIIGVILFVGIQWAGSQLIALFLDVNHSEAYAFALAGAKIYAYAFLMNGMNIIASGYFSAISNPKQAAIIAVSRVVGVVAGLFLLVPVFGITGIWLSVPAAEAMTLLVSATFFYRQWSDGMMISSKGIA